MKIRFAKYDFDGPYAAARWTPPPSGGLYAVMVHGSRGLYVATYGMPGSTALTRLAVETHLVHHYQPEGNEPITSPAPSVKKTLRTHKYN